MDHLLFVRARCERAEVLEVTEESPRRRWLHGPVFSSILREVCTSAGDAAPSQLSV